MLPVRALVMKEVEEHVVYSAGGLEGCVVYVDGRKGLFFFSCLR